MKKRIVSVMAALVCLITLVVGAVPVSAEDNLPNGKYIVGYEVVDDSCVVDFIQQWSLQSSTIDLYLAFSFSDLAFCYYVAQYADGYYLYIYINPFNKNCVLNTYSDHFFLSGDSVLDNCSSASRFGCVQARIIGNGDSQSFDSVSFLAK